MTTFYRSLYSRYQKEEKAQSEELMQWPVLFRGPMASYKLDELTLQIGVENQQPRQLTWEQMTSLPAMEEAHVIASKGGWVYRGQWRILTFQTLLSMFSTPHLYNWVRLDGLNDQQMVIERRNLLNWRVLYECDGHPLTSLYGGPLLIHNFENFIEYSFPHLKSLTLLENKDYHFIHPITAYGFPLQDMRVQPGKYYAIHQERVFSVDWPGEIR